MAILVERDHIGIFGKMNSGKSSLMNLLTQQATSIVDPTPGTTADTKVALQEIHGIGPVKLYDTAGVDEENVLGDKKREKVFSALKECDLVLLTIDPARDNLTAENELLKKAREDEKQLLVVYNLFRPEDAARVAEVEKAIPDLRFYRKITLSAIDPASRQPLLNFVIANFESKNRALELLPFLEPNAFYLLIVPMDAETPPGRLLRPQAMVEEYITRHWAWPVCFRLDLKKARSADPNDRETEKKRFLSVAQTLGPGLKAVITDSQAMDVMGKWCPDNLALTTFSIVMINYMSRGRLKRFAEGTRALASLKAGDRVLIAEACNHSRIGEDIGTVQIPKYLEKRFPGVVIEHNFGREFQENKDLAKYKLVIHCGGCMISPQTLLARVRDLENVGAPFSNYGLVLAYAQGPEAFEKVLAPWGIVL